MKLEALDRTTTRPIRADLAAQGASNYFALPTRASAMGLASITVLTDRMGGFEDEDIKKSEVLVSASAPTFEANEIRRRSTELANNGD